MPLFTRRFPRGFAFITVLAIGAGIAFAEGLIPPPGPSVYFGSGPARQQATAPADSHAQLQAVASGVNPAYRQGNTIGNRVQSTRSSDETPNIRLVEHQEPTGAQPRSLGNALRGNIAPAFVPATEEPLGSELSINDPAAPPVERPPVEPMELPISKEPQKIAIHTPFASETDTTKNDHPLSISQPAQPSPLPHSTETDLPIATSDRQNEEPIPSTSAMEPPDDGVEERTDRSDPLDKAFGSSRKEGGRLHLERKASGVMPLISMLGGLCLVLAAFFCFAMLMRRVTPTASRTLPKEVAEPLGRIPLTQKVQLHLLRIGNRLLLLSVTADGATTVSEMTDADEVVQVLGLCRKHDGQGSSAIFQQVLGGLLAGSEKSGKKKNGNLDDLYTGRSGEESLTSLLAAGLASPLTPQIPSRGK